jgi:hypothetical protein
MKGYILLTVNDDNTVKVWNGEIHTKPQNCLASFPLIEGKKAYGPFEIELPEGAGSKAWYETQQPINVVYGGSNKIENKT